MKWTHEGMKSVSESLVERVSMMELGTGEYLHAVRFSSESSIAIITRNNDNGEWYYTISHMYLTDGVSVSDDDIDDWSLSGMAAWEGYEGAYEVDKKEMESEGHVYMLV